MKRHWHLGLRGKLLLLIALTLLPAIGLSAYSSVQRYQHQQAASTAHVLRTARMIKMSERHALDEAAEFVSALAVSPAVYGRDLNQCRAALNRVVANFHTFSAIGVAAADGNVNCAAGLQTFPPNIAQLPFFTTVTNAQALTFGPYEFDVQSNKQLVYVGMPVRGDEGARGRIVFAALDLAKIETMAFAAQLAPDSVIKRFDQSGLMLERLPDQMGVAGMRVPTLPLLQQVRARGADVDGVVTAASTDGAERLYAYTVLHKIPGQTVYLAVGISNGAAFGAARTALRTDLLTLIALSGVSLFVAWFGSNALVLRKLQRVVDTADRIRAGDVGARSGLAAPGNGGDEFARLGGAIDTMADALQRRIANLHWHDVETRQMMEMSEAMHACLNQDELLAVVRIYVARLFPTHAVAMYLMHPSGDNLEQKLTWNRPASVPEFLVEDCWAMRRGQPYLVDGAGGSPSCKHVTATATALASYLCVPLVAHGQVLGMLHLQNPAQAAGETAGETAYESQQLGRSVADHITLVLANLRLQTMLRIQATRDPLTGLFNRRFMEESLRRETRNADRHRSPISIIMLDLDHFKRFNDDYGHAAGDAVLRETAHLLETQMRGGDLACRYGGEEFVVILPDTALAQASVIASGLCEAVRATTVAWLGRTLGPLTASLGVASYTDHGRNWEQVLHAADVAMLRAKKWRNHVVVYDASEGDGIDDCNGASGPGRSNGSGAGASFG